MTKPAECALPERAAVFVDGSNFYNACVHQPKRDAGLLSAADYYDLDFMALARKLAGDGRKVVSARYYVGRLKQESAPFLHAQQQRLIDNLKKDGVVFVPGRVVKRAKRDRSAENLGRILQSRQWESGGWDPALRRELGDLLRKIKACSLDAWLGKLSARGELLPPDLEFQLRSVNADWEEKEVDVKLAVDMISMAHRDEYDVAYLLSGDSDFAPAVKEARNQIGRKVFAVFPSRVEEIPNTGRTKFIFPKSSSSELIQAVNTVIPIDGDFFAGLRRKKRQNRRMRKTI